MITYSTIQDSKWQNRLFRASVAGSIFWILAIVGQWCVLFDDGFWYGIFVMAPALFLIPPMHLLLIGLTAYSWSAWSNKRRRMITLICSLSVPVLLFLITTLRLF